MGQASLPVNDDNVARHRQGCLCHHLLFHNPHCPCLSIRQCRMRFSKATHIPVIPAKAGIQNIVVIARKEQSNWRGNLRDSDDFHTNKTCRGIATRQSLWDSFASLRMTRIKPQIPERNYRICHSEWVKRLKNPDFRTRGFFHFAQNDTRMLTLCQGINLAIVSVLQVLSKKNAIHMD